MKTKRAIIATCSDSSEKCSLDSSVEKTMKKRERTKSISKTWTPSPKRKTRKISDNRHSPVSPYKTGRSPSLETKIKSRNIVKMLEKVCPRADECLALSAEYMPHINKVFHSFSDFTMLSQDNKRQFVAISSGANGFVNRLHYTDKTGVYSATAILKSANKADASKLPDNSVYEGLVGLYFVNDLCYYFPCFVETYGIYKYKSAGSALKKQLLSNKSANYQKIPVEEFTKELEPLFTNTKTNRQIKEGKRTLYNSRAIGHAFDNPGDLAVMVQSIENANSMYIHLKELIVNLYTAKKEAAVFQINEELITMIFQIYSVLGYLSDKYTHNDLHISNVLVHSLEHKYVKMVYHMKIGDDAPFKIAFYTNKIMKIIDYGRSFVNGEHFSSLCFYQSICQHERKIGGKSAVTKTISPGPTEYECDANNPEKFQEGEKICGSKIGFTKLWKITENPETTNYVSTIQRNKTVDLLFLQKMSLYMMEYIYKNEMPNPKIPPKILDYMKSPIFYLLMNVFSIYKENYKDHERKFYENLMATIKKYLVSIGHPITKNMGDDADSIHNLVFNTISTMEILDIIHKKNPSLDQAIVKYKTMTNQGLNGSKNTDAFFQILFQQKERAKTAEEKRAIEKQIKTLLLLSNIHYFKGSMYSIPEYINYRDKNALYNVEKVRDMLIDMMTEENKKITGMDQEYQVDYEKTTHEYFTQNLYAGTEKYQYFGELHVYLDRSGRNTHFVAAPSK